MNREDFDILKTNVIYFDNGATTLKPKVVLDSIVSYYTKYTANAHRGDYNNSLIVDRLYEETRSKVAKFINAFRSDEIVFTKGTTESLNIIVFGFMKHVLTKKDEVILSKAEHASNVLPWLELQKEIGFKIKYVPLDKDLKLTLDNLKSVVTKNTKVISIAHITNTVGDIRPIKEIGKFAKENNIYFVVDGAQSIPHLKTDVNDLNIDFLAFSGHKIFGPSGTGVLYGKLDLLNKLKPFVFGGGSVKDSTYANYIIEDVPQRFEAGLQDYAGIIGLGEAIKYFQEIGIDNIENHIENLNKMITLEFQKLGIDILGDNDFRKRKGIISFNIKVIHSKEIAEILNQNNIFIRAGMHCVHSWFNSNKIDGSARISLSIYNTEEDCRKVIEEMKKICNLVR